MISIRGIASTLLVLAACILSFGAQAQTPGVNKTWTACWADGSDPVHNPSFLHCISNGPARCAISGTFAQGTSVAACTYDTSVGASATCTPDPVYQRANCNADNSSTFCYVPVSPPPPGEPISYPAGTGICYPINPPGTPTVTPQTLNFGEQPVGTQSTPRTFTFGVPSGQQWIEPSNLSISGAAYSVVSNTCMGTLLYPGQSCTVSVVFLPTLAGTSTGVATLQYRTFGDSSVHSVSGGMTGAGVTSASGPRVTFSPLTTAFPSTLYGVTSAQKTITITNSGLAPLNISSVKTVGAEFGLVSNTCSAPIQPNGQCAAVVQFVPRALGSRSGALEVASDAPTSPDQSPLTGTGASPPSQYPPDDVNAGDGGGDELPTWASLTLVADSAKSDAGGAGNALLLDEPVRPGDTTIVTAPRLPDTVGGLLAPFNFTQIPVMQSSIDKLDLHECTANLEDGILPDQTQVATSDGVETAIHLAANSLHDIGQNVQPEGVFVLDPIHSLTGNKIHRQLDYRSAGQYPLISLRTYNSLPLQSSAMVTQSFGSGWFSNWDRAVKQSGSTARVTRGDGKSYQFTSSGSGGWNAASGVLSTLEQFKDSSGATTGWRYTTKNKEVENFDGSGRLTSIITFDGKAYQLTYDATAHLASVADPFGRTVQFEYDMNGQVSTLVDPAGNEVSYSYDANGRLVSVTYPDGRTRQYRYEHPTFAFALTSIVDETGQTYATFTYDSNGRATGNSFVGGAGTGSITYSGTTSTTTTPDGTTWARSFVRNGASIQVGSVAPSCGDCGSVQQTFVYDARSGLLTSLTDMHGAVTTYSYDGRGLPLQIVQASGSTVRRTYNYTWHPTLRVPTQVSGPVTTTSYQYDSAGRLTQKTLTGGGLSRTTTYAYNSAGLLSEIDGPRTDIVDKTSFAYDALGNLISSTDANGRIAQFTYDDHGRRISGTYPDGTSISIIYDERGRVLSRTASGATTTHTYNDFGLLASDTDPDGVVTTYSYDPAHRLTGKDRLGEKLRYTLDSSGRTTRTDLLDAANLLSSTASVEYDGLGRIKKQIGSGGQAIQYAYIETTSGPNLKVTDQLGNITTTYMDLLGRVNKVIPPLAATISNQVNQEDWPTSVQPPGVSATTYTYNGIGDNTIAGSPDTGTTTRTFDLAGNLLTEVDARNASATYAYDALGRVSQVTYSDGKSVVYGYDAGLNGASKLTSITDPSGSTTFAYDTHGRLVASTQVMDGIPLSVQYARDSGGKVTSVTYPSGRALSVAYLNGRVDSLVFDHQSILTDVQYFPFGPAESWLFGGSKEFTRYIDQDNRIARYLTPSGERRLTFDLAGRIQRLDDVIGTTTTSQNFTYDALGRLTAFNGFTSASPSESQSFTYTLNGNRLTSVLNGASKTYTYATNTNRLTSATMGGQTATYSYDAAGNMTFDGSRTLTYDARGRMVQAVFGGVTTTYQYNALGQRTKKANATGTRRYIYDAAGHMLGEYDSNGNALQELVWLGDTPVSVIAPGQGTCSSGITQVTNSSFSPFVEGGGLEVQGGNPGDWALGSYTLAPDGAAHHSLQWVSGKAYGYTLSYDGAGHATVVVRDGAVTLFSLAWPQGSNGALFTGNAIQVGVRALSDQSAQIKATVDTINGAAVNGVLAAATSVTGSILTTTYASPSFAGPLSVSGTLTLTFTGDSPPGAVEALAFKVNTGNAACNPITVGYVWTDHLDTPREVTDTGNRTLWKWDSLPYGESAPNESPAGLPPLQFNQRFPGQYFDYETGLHQNWFRYFNPTIGRYIQADPIGLRGGLNLYGYVNSNPMSLVDRTGTTANDQLCMGDRPRDQAEKVIKKAKKIVEAICIKPDEQCSDWELRARAVCTLELGGAIAIEPCRHATQLVFDSCVVNRSAPPECHGPVAGDQDVDEGGG